MALGERASTAVRELPLTNKSILNVQINDEWETYLIRFTTFFPIDDLNDDLQMDSDKTGAQVMKMTRSTEVTDWMKTKYGMSMRPWECIIKMPNTKSGDCGQFEEGTEDQKLHYGFQKRNNHRNEIIIEREPKRSIYLENPSTYRGEYGDKKCDQQTINDRTYLINGMINKADGNFLAGFFLNQIREQSVVLGPYPLYEIDIQKI